MLLEEAMDEDFQTVLEDGSGSELGELFCLMWRNCGAGDFALVNNALASEKARADTLARSQGFDSNTGDAMDSDDDSDEGGMDVVSEEAAANFGIPAQPCEPAPPLVDADGFMTAGAGKKKKKGKK
jgi:hypothetical protein